MCFKLQFLRVLKLDNQIRDYQKVLSRGAVYCALKDICSLRNLSCFWCVKAKTFPVDFDELLAPFYC